MVAALPQDIARPRHRNRGEADELRAVPAERVDLLGAAARARRRGRREPAGADQVAVPGAVHDAARLPAHLHPHDPQPDGLAAAPARQLVVGPHARRVPRRALGGRLAAGPVLADAARARRRQQLLPVAVPLPAGPDGQPAPPGPVLQDGARRHPRLAARGVQGGAGDGGAAAQGGRRAGGLAEPMRAAARGQRALLEGDLRPGAQPRAGAD